jgi:hypothetical protein
MLFLRKEVICRLRFDGEVGTVSAEIEMFRALTLMFLLKHYLQRAILSNLQQAEIYDDVPSHGPGADLLTFETWRPISRLTGRQPFAKIVNRSTLL